MKDRVTGYAKRETGYGIRGMEYETQNPKPVTQFPKHKERYPLPVTRNSKKGFSFFEVMTTVAVLSLGIVMIFQAFLSSLNSFGYYLTNLEAQCWADEKIWEVSDSLMRETPADSYQTDGNLKLANRDVAWLVEVNKMDEQENFFKLDLTVSWQEGNRKIELYRTAYAGI